MDKDHKDKVGVLKGVVLGKKIGIYGEPLLPRSQREIAYKRKRSFII